LYLFFSIPKKSLQPIVLPTILNQDKQKGLFISHAHLIRVYSLNLRRSSVKNVIKVFTLLVIGFCCSFSALAAVTAAENSKTNYVVTIESPVDGATFQNNTESVQVTFSINPDLKAGDEVSLLVDGKVDPGSSPGPVQPSKMNVNLSSLERGPHTLQVFIKSKSGETLGQSSLITIHQQRPSKLLPPKS